MFADNGKESFPRPSNRVGNSYDREDQKAALVQIVNECGVRDLIDHVVLMPRPSDSIEDAWHHGNQYRDHRPLHNSGIPDIRSTLGFIAWSKQKRVGCLV